MRAPVPGIDVGIRENVAVVTFARPEKMNALTGAMMDALPEILEGLGRDPEVRCLVLRGAGRAFCAGGDLATVKGARDRAVSELADELAERQRATLLLATMEVPTIASVNGIAAGAGLALALACDIRIAASSARFATAFAQVGFSGDYGGAWTLQRLVGPARARELYFSGAVVSAEEAARIGLVNRTVIDEALDAETMTLARRIAKGPPLAIRRMKANMNLALTSDLPTLLRAEAEASAALMHSEDNAEALAAFREKRAPVFTGR